MNKFGKWAAGLGAVAGLFFVMTRPAVIEKSPEPIRSALNQLSSDFAKTASGRGFDSKKEAGGGGDDGGIPLLRNNGLGN